MPELSDAGHMAFRAAWAAHPVLPLEVSRAKYDEPFPREWEVLAHETPSCQVPIAAFSAWEEAQQWADRQAHWAHEQGAHPGDTRGAIREWWEAERMESDERPEWPPALTPGVARSARRVGEPELTAPHCRTP